MALCSTPGVSVAIGRRGDIVWEQGFGYADLAGMRPVTPESVAKSGSIAKTYTATAVMQLVERASLGLEAPINHYLPFEVVNPLGDREITVRDLLTHRSGLSGDAAGSDFAEPAPLGEELAARYESETNDFYYGSALPQWAAKVGEQLEYSNLGIATLGYIVELTNPENLSISDYVQRHIMDPLGMTSSSFPPAHSAMHVPAQTLAGLTTGYARVGPIHVPSPDLSFAEHPAGTAILRASDHLRLLLAYMGGGTFRGAKVLEPETVELMLSPQVTGLAGEKSLAVGSDDHLGLVWWVARPGQPDEHFHHGGAHMWGWTNLGRGYPGLDLAIVVMANQWSLLDDPQLGCYADCKLIANFAAGWLRYERPGVAREGQQRPWGWRAAYYVGLTMGDRLQALLGMPSPLTPEMVEAMASGVRAPCEWVADGFRAGIEDVAQTDRTLAGVRALLESRRLRVAPAELALLHRELGGTVGVPVVAETW